jgi:hypothetical protein
MSIEVSCPSCGANLKLAEKFARRGLVCPKCQHQFRLPGEVESQAKREVPAPRAANPPTSSPQTRPTIDQRRPQLSGAMSPAHGTRMTPGEETGTDSGQNWGDPSDLELQARALPPRQEAGMPVKGRKRRISQTEEGSRDWPFYALGIAGMCLVAFVQGLFLWSNLAPSPTEAGRPESVLVGHPGAGAPAAEAAPETGSFLDSYLSRKLQRELGALSLVTLVVMTLFALVGVGATFGKAGKPVWGAIVPLYNLVLLLKLAGRPNWWLLLLCVPFLNLFVFLFISIDIAHNFGKRTPFGLGLTFLGFVFYPLLGFGQAHYRPYW